MLEQFQNFIQKEKLFTTEDKILLAVSGGMDSVLMCELFHKAGFKFAIAHCNFQLRGDESNQDEKFVSELSKKYNVPFFVTSFQTADFANETGISIQMAARELRFKWFQELLETENYDYVAAAHHLDDQIETFFVNLSRGTGIAGLHGILPKHGNIIHPILFVYRKEIEKYITENKIEFREDSSNKSTKYKRNKLRHNILPLFEELNPNFSETITKNINLLKESEIIFRKEINRVKRKAVHSKSGKTFINIKILKSYNQTSTYLYEFLIEYNFSFALVEDILKSMDEISGKQFYSDTHRLLKDREYLIIAPISADEENKFGDDYFIEKDQSEINKPLNLTFNLIDNSEDFKILKQSSIASLDYSKIEFPLILRKWKKGDYFYPFGMNKKKKLSDFFINEKISIIDKENIWLICSGEKIAWIVGHRIDNRFCISKNTKQIFQIELKKN